MKLRTRVAVYFFSFFWIGITASMPAYSSPSVDSILDEVRGHEFHPLSKDHSFTMDRHLGKHGIANLDNTDWKVRLMAISRLTQAEDKIGEIVNGLQDENQHVRQICAAALGIRKAKQAAKPLEELLKNDASVLVRSQAAMSLGQIESQDSLPLLRERLEDDPHRDVKHQCELAIDQIEKNMGATQKQLRAFQSLDPKQFESAKEGAPALDFSLDDTEGKSWTLSDFKGEKWVVLIWIFADWCPVCHSEFRDLIAMKDEFAQENIQVFTVEAHDKYRSRLMVGKEGAPDYWFSDQPFDEVYTEKIWWPHLMDLAGKTGAAYGVDPMSFAVHAEYINRPATVIIDPEGMIRFLYAGTYWGDRPTIHETLEMIRNQDFEFEHPKRLQFTEDQ